MLARPTLEVPYVTDIIERKNKLLQEAAAQFEFYRHSHAAKVAKYDEAERKWPLKPEELKLREDAREKALVNGQWVQRLLNEVERR